MGAAIKTPTITELEKLIVIDVIEGEEFNLEADYVVFMDLPENEHTLLDLEDSLFHYAIEESHFAEWAADNDLLNWSDIFINCEGELTEAEGVHEYCDLIEMNPDFMMDNVKAYLIDNAIKINS